MQTRYYRLVLILVGLVFTISRPELNDWTIKLRQIVFVLALSLPVSGLADFAAGVKAYEAGDYATALREFQSLAGEGNAAAQRSLGNMYRNGDGVLQDDVQAYAWYNLASVRGDKSAGTLRDKIRESMTPFQIEEGQLLSRELLALHFLAAGGNKSWQQSPPSHRL